MIKNFRMSRKVFAWPYILFMLLFIVTPLVMVLVNAFLADGKLTLDNFVDFFSDRSSLDVLAVSLIVGFVTTLLCLLLGYPIAYILSKTESGKILVLLFILPMWVNFLIRTLATKSIFEWMGVKLGIGTVIFGMVYNYLPFMILPLHTTLSNIDKSYAEAAGPRSRPVYRISKNGASSVAAGDYFGHNHGVYPHHLHLCHKRAAFKQHNQAVRRFDKPQIQPHRNLRSGKRNESDYARAGAVVQFLYEQVQQGRLQQRCDMKKWLSKAYIYIMLAIMYAPILLVILFSFFNTSRFSFDNGFSFESYVSIFTSPKSPELWSAIKNTLLIAVVSSSAATVLGTFATIGIFCMGKKTRRIVENINQLPVINSEIVMAISLMVFFATVKFIPKGYAQLIISHIAFCTPYVVLSVMPRLMQLDPNIYEAALDLGAGPTRALFKVMFPLLAPAILSGFVMSFTLSMDDFIITQFNKGTGTNIETLSTYIYSDVRVKGMEPFWFAIFSIIFVVVLSTLLIINLKKQSKKGAVQK